MLPVASTSSRILFDVPCCVCGDNSSGKHYGIHACDGCAGFFKRSVRRGRRYQCKSKHTGTCIVDKAHRNQCRACRYLKCLKSGMKRAAVQNERGPRTSTLRKQVELILKEPNMHRAEETDSSYGWAMPPHPFLAPETYAYFGNLYNHPGLMYAPHVPAATLPPPPPPPPSPPLLPSIFAPNDPIALRESAAQVLFMNVGWVKSVAAFTSLPLRDRLILLEETWKDLFIIGAAQYLYPANFDILCARNPWVDVENARLFQLIIDELMQIHPEPGEYELLRAVVLYRTELSDRAISEREFLQEQNTIRILNAEAKVMLHEFSARTNPADPTKSRRILRTLPLMNQIRNSTIIDLFFRGTIGWIPLESVIGDIYKRQLAREVAFAAANA